MRVTHDGDWAPCVIGALLAHGAEQQSPEAAQSSRADDEEIRFSGRVEQHLGGLALDGLGRHVDLVGVGTDLVHRVAEVVLRGLP